MASASRSFAGLAVCSEPNSRRAAALTSSTARSNAASLACDGRVKPLSLRTNCSDAARISSSLAGGSKLNKVRMLRHMVRSRLRIRRLGRFLRGGLPARDGVGDLDRAARHLGVQPLDHAALDLDDAFVAVLRQIERGDDLARRLDLLGRRRERGVAGFDLPRMDQRLAVETEIARLPAFGGETFGVAEIVVDAVQNVEAVGA